ncbi:helix-turn-helix domain-containing protein [Parabacteroides sp. Marseille-P3160]|uniref:helix-turn-helix domain-containing protein n=1 Tax=Parabacteroides sp. Marseille-P3160 TaxID=1917887 RepID=UPI0009B9E57E|nr:helix-turn-helix transcriptional regulator [Parabacteroides sp. Marseille-P3160]
MDFRRRIKEVCQEKGITQKDLAERLGITDISLNKTLRGEYPQLQSLEKIASALNVPITDLFEQPKQNVIACPKCGTILEIKEKE